jgi:hypothetical protein
MGQQGAEAFQIAFRPADQIARRGAIGVKRQRRQADIAVNPQ